MKRGEAQVVACEWCGGPFVKKRKDARYCGTHCRLGGCLLPSASGAAMLREMIRRKLLSPSQAVKVAYGASVGSEPYVRKALLSAVGKPCEECAEPGTTDDQALCEKCGGYGWVGKPLEYRRPRKKRPSRKKPRAFI